MHAGNSSAIRRAALAGAVGAGLTAVSGIFVQSVVQPSTTVSDKMWSYPWSSAALIPISIVYAALHVLVVIGLIGLRASRPAGSSHWGQRGLSLAVAGTLLLLVGELASLAARHAHTDDTGALVVGIVFAGAIILNAVGFLVAGQATARAGVWPGWRRWTPLATGVWTCALLALNATKALPTGVAIYGLFLLAIFWAMLTAPSPIPAGHATAPQPA